MPRASKRMGRRLALMASQRHASCARARLLVCVRVSCSQAPYLHCSELGVNRPLPGSAWLLLGKQALFLGFTPIPALQPRRVPAASASSLMFDSNTSRRCLQQRNSPAFSAFRSISVAARLPRLLRFSLVTLAPPIALTPPTPTHSPTRTFSSLNFSLSLSLNLALV